jgi:hypothetical protein
MFHKSPAYAGVKIYNHLLKKALKIICMSILFILWMDFLCMKLDKHF